VVAALIAMVAVVIVVPAMATVRPFFCVRDRYRMAETEVSVALAFTGIPNAVRVAPATDRQSAAGSVPVALIAG
jgi:hypothetical protein